MLNQWLWREQRSHCTGTATCTEPSHSLWGQAGLPSLDGCTRQRSQQAGEGDSGDGGGEWKGHFQEGDTGFKCCLDAKVILLSEEPWGIISCSLGELTLAMLMLAAQAGESEWGKHPVPGWGRPYCCQHV